jgi:hypothetical protein
MPVKAKILTQAWGDALRLDYQIITYHLECGINFNNLSILAMDVIIVTDYVKNRSLSTNNMSPNTNFLLK